MFLIGDRDHMHGLSRAAGIPVREIAAPVEAMAPGDGLPVLHHPLARPATPGLPDPGNAASVIAIIERGVDIVRSGAASALCTNPVAKKLLQDGAGFAHPGHTEFLAALSAPPGR